MDIILTCPSRGDCLSQCRYVEEWDEGERNEGCREFNNPAFRSHHVITCFLRLKLDSTPISDAFSIAFVETFSVNDNSETLDSGY